MYIENPVPQLRFALYKLPNPVILELILIGKMVNTMARRTDGGVRFRPVGSRRSRTAPVYSPRGTGCPAIEQAVQQGVTVITYDADVPDSGRLCHAGQDLVRAGAIAAGVMARLIRPPEHVLIVTGNLRMEAHKGRVDGFCRRLLELGFSEDAYRVIETNEMPELTGELVAQALQADSRLHAVYMACQPLSGCIAGIRKARRTTRPHIVCNDLTPTAKRYLREGTVDFVIGQSFSQESFHAVLAMYQMLLRGVKPKRELYYTDLRLITQEML